MEILLRSRQGPRWKSQASSGTDPRPADVLTSALGNAHTARDISTCSPQTFSANSGSACTQSRCAAKLAHYGPHIPTPARQNISYTPIVWSACAPPRQDTLAVSRPLSGPIAPKRNFVSDVVFLRLHSSVTLETLRNFVPDVIFLRLHSSVALEIRTRCARQIRTCWPPADLPALLDVDPKPSLGAPSLLLLPALGWPVRFSPVWRLVFMALILVVCFWLHPLADLVGPREAGLGPRLLLATSPQCLTWLRRSPRVCPALPLGLALVVSLLFVAQEVAAMSRLWLVAAQRRSFRPRPGCQMLPTSSAWPASSLPRVTRHQPRVLGLRGTSSRHPGLWTLPTLLMPSLSPTTDEGSSLTAHDTTAPAAVTPTLATQSADQRNVARDAADQVAPPRDTLEPENAWSCPTPP